MQNHYAIAGLEVASDFVLPALAGTGAGPADLSLLIAPYAPAALAAPTYSGPNWTATNDQWQLLLDDGARLSQQDDVLSLWMPDRSALPQLLPWLMGAGFVMALSRRGDIAWHASAVAFGDEAVLVMGESGLGKSTFAAALIAQGGLLLADDIVCPRLTKTAAAVHPVLLSLRLAPDAAGHFAWPAQPAAADKVAVAAPRVQVAAPCRIAAIYILAPRSGGEGTIERMDHSLALGELVKNIFSRAAVSLARHVPPAIETARNLALFTPVFRVSAPDGFEHLTDFVRNLCERR